MNHEDHVKQLTTASIGPIIQFSWTYLVLIMWIGALFQLPTSGPLYKVVIITPAKDIKVPRTFAIPRGFLISTVSNLYKRCKRFS